MMAVFELHSEAQPCPEPPLDILHLDGFLCRHWPSLPHNRPACRVQKAVPPPPSVTFAELRAVTAQLQPGSRRFGRSIAWPPRTIEGRNRYAGRHSAGVWAFPFSQDNFAIQGPLTGQIAADPRPRRPKILCPITRISYKIIARSPWMSMIHLLAGSLRRRQTPQAALAMAMLRPSRTAMSIGSSHQSLRSLS